MVREILYKAKHVHAMSINENLDGVWTVGYLADEKYINTGEAEVLIDPETICQFTGLTDCGDERVWENDIVNGLFYQNSPANGIVTFRNGAFGLLWETALVAVLGEFTPFAALGNVKFAVVGNKFDDPKLMETFFTPLDADEKMYTVSMAVDGRIDIQVRANSFQDAQKKADANFCSVDLRKMECVEWHAVNAECENGEFRDYD